jgi:hypothetical protein
MANQTTKSGCKSLIAVSLTHFSGFSGISIDFLDSQDIKTMDLRQKQIAFFNSILSARLISVLAFVFCRS